MENDVDVIRGQKYFKKRIFCLACKPIKFSVNYRDYVTWDLSLVAGEVEPSVEFVVREGNCKKVVSMWAAGLFLRQWSSTRAYNYINDNCNVF